MSLFIRTPNRELEISDAYIVALTFLVSFAVGKIVKLVIEKQILRKNKEKNKNIFSSRGGTYYGVKLSDETELVNTVLACIAYNESCLVKDPRIITLIFDLVKAKTKNESLILTPNMIRFLVLKYLNTDQTLIVKMGNFIVSSNNQARLIARVSGSAIMGFVTGLLAAFSYGIFMTVIFFNLTENCSYRCSDFFEQLPKEGPIQIVENQSTGNLVIGGNDDAKQVQFYTPTSATNKVTVNANGELEETKIYNKARTKAKQVNFSDFKKTDPVLSKFDGLEEPIVPQRFCPIDDPHDIINIRID